MLARCILVKPTTNQLVYGLEFKHVTKHGWSNACVFESHLSCFFDVPEVANDGKKFAAIFILAHDIFYPSVCRRIKHLNWHIPKSLLLFTHSEQTSECKCIHRQGHHGEGLLHRRRLRRRPVHGRPRAPSARPSTSPGSASMPGSEQRRHGSRRRTRSSWRSPLSSS